MTQKPFINVSWTSYANCTVVDLILAFFNVRGGKMRNLKLVSGPGLKMRSMYVTGTPLKM
jgi:hypothetical protein